MSPRSLQVTADGRRRSSDPCTQQQVSKHINKMRRKQQSLDKQKQSANVNNNSAKKLKANDEKMPHLKCVRFIYFLWDKE